MIHIFLKVIMKKIFCETLNPKNAPDLNIYNYELYPWNIIIMICNYMTFNIFSINVFTHMFTDDLRRKTNWLLRFHHLFLFFFNYVFIFERTVNNVNLKVTVLHDFTWNKLTKIFISFSQSETISCLEYFTLYRIVHRLFWSLLFLHLTSD